MTHCSHDFPLSNVRYWEALGASIGECVCGSTVVVKPKVATTIRQPLRKFKAYLNSPAWQSLDSLLRGTIDRSRRERL